MSEKLTVAIIGAGNIAGGFDEKSTNSHAVYSHAGAYTKHGAFVLKHIFDVDQKRAHEFANAWNVASVCSSEDEITDSYHDVISICSPDKYHFQTLKRIIRNKSCKTVFVEKPLGLTGNEVSEIVTLAEQSDINIVVNFQRHFDATYEKLKLNTQKILAVNCYYIKGLNHIGITMIDTLVMLFGLPKTVYSYNKIYNSHIEDETYEFILFYDQFNITVKTIDEPSRYNYHIFDIDILTDLGRFTITDNGNTLEKKIPTSYDYGDVNVLESSGEKISTEYKNSMLESINYLYNITVSLKQHTINTVYNSYNSHLIVDKIIESYQQKQNKNFEETSWKK